MLTNDSTQHSQPRPDLDGKAQGANARVYDCASLLLYRLPSRLSTFVINPLVVTLSLRLPDLDISPGSDSTARDLG